MTSITTPMLDTYPDSINLDRAKLAAAIETLSACAQACTACADACLSEDRGFEPDRNGITTVVMLH